MKLFKPNIQRLAKKKNVHALIKLLKGANSDTSTRLAAITALGEMSNLQAVDALIEALKDSDSEVRQASAAALGQLGYTRAEESQVAALKDNKYWIRKQIAAELNQLGWQPVDKPQSARLVVAQQDKSLADVEPLIVTLRDSDSGARQQAVASLVNLGTAAIEPLIAALQDNDSVVRQRAAEVLGLIGDSRAVEPLIEMLRDTYWLVRQAAAAALGQLRDSRAIEPLSAALRDNYSGVRQQAATSLGGFRDSRVVELLIGALRNGDRGVNQAAAKALREIGDPRSEDALREYEYHVDNTLPRLDSLTESSAYGSFTGADLQMQNTLPRSVSPTESQTDMRPATAIHLQSDNSHDSSLVHKERESVDGITKKETSRPQTQLRHLHAQLPKQARVGDRIPLQVRVALLPALSKSTPLRAFSIPPQGVDVKLVLNCPGFLLHSSSMATVHVIPEADSDWTLFELEALHEGVSTLKVSAFLGGAFLGTLTMQLTIDRLAARGQSVERVAFLSLRPPQEGEVTLVIRYDPFSAVYRYQFRSAAFGETDELQSGPLRRKQEEAIADLITSLNEQARDLTGYTAEETRIWLQGKGTELWNELIPKELEKIFWQQRGNIKCMTILSAGDPMPWEAMYPTNDAGDEAGFLAEQFPVVRWMFGPAPTALLHCSQPFFVMPEDVPPTAEDELVALRQIMGEGSEVNELTPLLSVFDHADFDMLHFACHNIFRSDSPTTSSIQMGSKQFVPTFLSKYKGRFYRRSPLVFLNACRSAGMAANYTWLAGWAKSFLAAGAGAFVGSSWEVRDTSASHFAEEFYRALFSGVPLGDAMKQARTAIQNEPGDPTWLAYTLYGNPAAILSKETPKLG